MIRNYLETLLLSQGRRLEVMNLAEEEQADLLHDLASILYSYCARLYGQRRAKHKTEAIVRQLRTTENSEEADAARGTDDHQVQ